MANTTMLNGTLEEQLRVMLVDKNNECAALRSHIKLLERSVAEEQEQKYRLLVEVADLKKQLKLL